MASQAKINTLLARIEAIEQSVEDYSDLTQEQRDLIDFYIEKLSRLGYEF